jgi:pilus assembly protein CpaD
MRKSVTVSGRAAFLGGLVLTASLLSGCAKMGTDHIAVGSVPDDYRTRHPIVIAENRKQLMVPVGEAPRQLSFAEREVLAGFLSGYNSGGAGAIQIAVPAGAHNSGSAGFTANEIAALAHKEGFGDRVVVGHYAAPADHPMPPVLVSFAAMSASAGPCGKWPEDILPDTENAQYHNFGCAYQNNLAAQLENPLDLLYPRRKGPIDAANRDKVIGDYRDNAGTWSPNIDY